MKKSATTEGQSASELISKRITELGDIVASWQSAMSAFSFVGFFASAGPINISGDAAHATWFQQEFLHGKDGSRRNVVGQYEDDYVKTGGRWYFKQRVYKVLNLS